MRKIKHQSLKMAALATLVAGAAALPNAVHATTFTESTDFSNNVGSPTVLPAGTDVVIGSFLNEADYFTFINLAPSTSYALSIALYGSSIFDANIYVNGVTTFSSLATFTTSGTVPVNGQLEVGLSFATEGVSNYTATLTAQPQSPSVPEPGVLSLTALGLACIAVGRKLGAKKA